MTQPQTDYRAFMTVWRFESPTSGEVRIVARAAEPNDKQVQHTYQRVLWQGYAAGAKDALAQAGIAPEPR